MLVTCTSSHSTHFTSCNPHSSLLTPHTSLLTLSITAGIPWMMVTELFLQEARPVAVTIGTAANWFANFTVALAFPYILVRGGREGSGGEGRGGEGRRGVGGQHWYLQASSFLIFLSFLPLLSPTHAGIPLPIWHSGVCGDMFHALSLPLPLPA